jgi:hypothetical protein
MWRHPSDCVPSSAGESGSASARLRASAPLAGISANRSWGSCFVARVALEHRMTGAGARPACGRGQRPTGGAEPASRIPDPSVHKLDRGRRAVLAVSVQYCKRPSQLSGVRGGPRRWGPGAAPGAGNPHIDLFATSFQVRPRSRGPTICCLRRDEQEERRDTGEAGTAKLMAHGSPGNAQLGTIWCRVRPWALAQGGGRRGSYSAVSARPGGFAGA